jgi:tetratricopeptide (TPR) repeat protein
MNIKSGFWGICLVVIFSSCVGYKEFSIEVFKPAKLAIPTDVRKIVLVSRNLKYKSDTLQNFYQRNNSLIKDKKKISIDSLAVSNCLDTLAARMMKLGNFDRVNVLPFSSFSKQMVNNVRPATPEWYSTVAEKNGADMLILLDMFSCFYSVKDGYSQPEAKVVTSNIWSVYNAKTQKITDRFSQIDTLYWNQLDENGNYKRTNIPDKKTAIVLAAGVIGGNYSRHILPSWTKVDRTYMLCNCPEFQDAIRLAQKNEWEKAVDIWSRFTESKNKQKQTSALYNLAVASEMNGDVDKAIEYTDKAAKASSGLFLGAANEQVRKYSAILYQRKNEIIKLNQQYEVR